MPTLSPSLRPLAMAPAIPATAFSAHLAAHHRFKLIPTLKRLPGLMTQIWTIHSKVSLVQGHFKATQLRSY